MIARTRYCWMAALCVAVVGCSRAVYHGNICKTAFLEDCRSTVQTPRRIDELIYEDIHLGGKGTRRVVYTRLQKAARIGDLKAVKRQLAGAQ